MALNHAIFTHLAASTESTEFPSTPLFQSLCLSMTLALDGMLAVQGGGKKQKVKPTLRKAAIVRTRRVIRNNYRLIPSIFDTVFDAYDAQGERIIPMLGVIFAVSLRLKVIAKKTNDGEPTQPLAERYTSAQKDKLFSLYLEKVMSSKTVVPRRIYTSIDDLWTSNMVSEEAIKEKVLPLADKMLIRSPEVVLPSELASADIAGFHSRLSLSTLPHRLHLVSGFIVCDSCPSRFGNCLGIKVVKARYEIGRTRSRQSAGAQTERHCKGAPHDRNLGSSQGRKDDERR